MEVHALTKPQYASLFAENPYITKVHSLAGKPAETVAILRQERFDFVVDLHKNLRSFRIRILLGVKGFSFPKLNLQKYLLVHFKWNLMPEKHIVDRYFDAVKPLGVSNDGRGLDFFIPENDRMQRSDLPDHLQAGYYAFAIGGNHNTKILPAHKAATVIGKLDKPVALLGGREDVGRAAAIVSIAGEDMAWNSCGKLRLGQSAWVVAHSLGVITNDTGLMHIAAAFRKPVVSVWGNTVPELGMYPYIVTHPERVAIIEQKGLSCRPCSKIGYRTCPEKHFNCMEKHSETQIAEALNKVVGAGQA